MRDDFDSVVADRFKVLDDVPVPDTWSRVLDRVPVPDTWSRVQFTEEVVTMIDLETPVPNEPRRKGPMRVVFAAVLAAAAVVAIALVVTRDERRRSPADEPSPTVTVPPTTPPRPLSPRATASCSRPGRTSSRRSTEHRRRGSSSPSAPGGRTPSYEGLGKNGPDSIRGHPET